MLTEITELQVAIVMIQVPPASCNCLAHLHRLEVVAWWATNWVPGTRASENSHFGGETKCKFTVILNDLRDFPFSLVYLGVLYIMTPEFIGKWPKLFRPLIFRKA